MQCWREGAGLAFEDPQPAPWVWTRCSIDACYNITTVYTTSTGPGGKPPTSRNISIFDSPAVALSRASSVQQINHRLHIYLSAALPRSEARSGALLAPSWIFCCASIEHLVSGILPR